MAELLPSIFRKSPAFTTNYDWQDFTQGLGYRTYYRACTKDSASKVYFLATRATLESQSADNTTANTGVYTYNLGAGAEMDIDFDIAFGIPAKVGGGTAYINFTILITADDHATITGTIYHYDGATETSLGASSTYNFTAQGAGTYIRVLLKITMTEKQFSAGDILRINLTTTDTDSGLYIYHDPSSALTFTDTNTRTVGSDLTVDIPFKVEM